MDTLSACVIGVANFLDNRQLDADLTATRKFAQPLCKFQTPRLNTLRNLLKSINRITRGN